MVPPASIRIVPDHGIIPVVVSCVFVCLRRRSIRRPIRIRIRFMVRMRVRVIASGWSIDGFPRPCFRRSRCRKCLVDFPSVVLVEQVLSRHTRYMVPLESFTHLAVGVMAFVSRARLLLSDFPKFNLGRSYRLLHQPLNPW